MPNSFNYKIKTFLLFFLLLLSWSVIFCLTIEKTLLCYNLCLSLLASLFLTGLCLNRAKVRYLIDGINNEKLQFVKTQVIAYPDLRKNFTGVGSLFSY